MAAQLGTVPAALQGCKAPPPLASFSSTHFGACSLPIVASALAPGSEALARYLHHVYGLPAPSARLHAWNWERKDVLWLDLLPRPVRAAACTSALGGNWSVAGLAREPLAAFHAISTKGNWAKSYSNTGFLWRFNAEEACHGETAHYGGTNASIAAYDETPEAHAGWIEVIHVQKLFEAGTPGRNFFERDLLWLNRAYGSGMWYHLGRTHVRDDFWGLQRPSWLTFVKFANDTRARGVDTILFPKRVGAPCQLNRSQQCGCGSPIPFYLTELVSLRPFVCDPSHNVSVFTPKNFSRGATACGAEVCLPGLPSLHFGWPNAASVGMEATIESSNRSHPARTGTGAPSHGSCTRAGGCVNFHGILLHCYPPQPWLQPRLMHDESKLAAQHKLRLQYDLALKRLDSAEEAFDSEGDLRVATTSGASLTIENLSETVQSVSLSDGGGLTE